MDQKPIIEIKAARVKLTGTFTRKQLNRILFDMEQAAEKKRELRKIADKKRRQKQGQQAAADQFFVMAGAAQQISEVIGKLKKSN
jgi:hypothetical protein